jgi:hypothetical protein
MVTGCAGYKIPDAPAMADVEFAQVGFESLVKGDPAAEGYFDWVNLNLFEVNVGREHEKKYKGYAQSQFRSEFIKSTSEAFRRKGMTEKFLTGWRLQSQTSEAATVRAFASTGAPFDVKIIRLNGRQKITAITPVHNTPS